MQGFVLFPQGSVPSLQRFSFVQGSCSFPQGLARSLQGFVPFPQGPVPSLQRFFVCASFMLVSARFYSVSARFCLVSAMFFRLCNVRARFRKV